MVVTGMVVTRMPGLVQVTAEQAQIPEKDATKAHDPDFSNHDLEEVAPKARDPNSSYHDPEEVATKSRDPDSFYCQRRKHEGARVLTVVRIFVVAIIARKIVRIARKTAITIKTKISVKSQLSDLVSVSTGSTTYSQLFLRLFVFSSELYVL